MWIFFAKIGADFQISFNITSRENITCDIFSTKIHIWCELGQNIFSLLNARGLRTCLKTTFLGSEGPKINVSNENSKWICPYTIALFIWYERCSKFIFNPFSGFRGFVMSDKFGVYAGFARVENTWQLS